MTKAGSHFSREWSGKTAEQRETWVQEKNSADLRGKASGRRTGKDLDARNKTVMSEEQKDQIVKRDKIAKGRGYNFVYNFPWEATTVNHKLPPRLQQPFNCSPHPFSFTSNPLSTLQKRNNFYKTRIHGTPPQKALQRFHTMWAPLCVTILTEHWDSSVLLLITQGSKSCKTVHGLVCIHT